MNLISSPRKQHGAVLVIGLIVLMLITLMVTAAFKFSTSNLRAVGNMQVRNEAIASANKAIEQVIGSWSFASAPTKDYIEVDIDNDGPIDYIVEVAQPVCLKATAKLGKASNDGCRIGLDGTLVCGYVKPADYEVTWELDATATGVSSGTKVRVRQGVSRLLNQTQCDALCPPAAGIACS